MPRRDGQGDVNPQRNAVASGAGEDAWEKVMNAKGGGGGAKEDDNGFTKMNTNFYLTDGESTEIIFLEDVPYVFSAHGLKMKSKKGATFYVTEGCQKSAQNHCLMCSSKLSTVGKVRNVVAFIILDGRGSYDKDEQDFDGVPVPKIFMTPLALAKAIKRLRDDVDGDLTDKVIKLSKDSKAYSISIATVKKGSGIEYKKAPKYDGALPNVQELYAPLSDEELERILSYQEDEPVSSAKGGKAKGVFNED